MIVDDLNLVRITILPSKADAPLVIDSDAVLAGAITFQLLQAISRRHPKILEGFGGIDQDEFAQHRPLEIPRIPANSFAPKQARGVPITEALNHLRS